MLAIAVYLNDKKQRKNFITQFIFIFKRFLENIELDSLNNEKNISQLEKDIKNYINSKSQNSTINIDIHTKEDFCYRYSNNKAILLYISNFKKNPNNKNIKIFNFMSTYFIFYPITFNHEEFIILFSKKKKNFLFLY
jgi:hypothetical protein